MGGSLPSPVTSPDKTKGLHNDVQDKMYTVYKNDLTDKRECDDKTWRWKTFSWRTTNNSR